MTSCIKLVVGAEICKSNEIKHFIFFYEELKH